MKKIFFFLLFFVLVLPVQSQEETPTPTDTVTDKIQELKDRVANRVAALKKEKLGGLTGTVKSSSDSALILIVEGAEYSVQLDEEAKVYSIDSQLRKKEVKLSEFEKDTTATVIGTVDTDKKTAIAQLFISKNPAVSLFGTVSEVSTKEGTIKILTNDGKDYIADIEVSTKSNQYDPQNSKLVKIGLSKIEKDSRIHVYGVSGEGENKITASRVLILPKNLTAEVKATPTPTQAEPTPTPSQ